MRPHGVAMPGHRRPRRLAKLGAREGVEQNLEDLIFSPANSMTHSRRCGLCRLSSKSKV